MSHSSYRRRPGRCFALPPRWQRLFWPTPTLSRGGLALMLWLEAEALALGGCAFVAALPGMAGLLYWFNRWIFNAATPRREDLTTSVPARTADAAHRAAGAGRSVALWHSLPLEQVFAGLHSTTTGLASAEAARRLGEHGPNEPQAARRISPWVLLAGQFKMP